MNFLNLFRRKQNKQDYSNLKLLIKDNNNTVNIKDISENIKSKNKYFHELSLTSNETIKFYIDCCYNGTTLIGLFDTIMDKYKKIVEYPIPFEGKHLKRGFYIFYLDKFLSLVDIWTLEVHKNDSPNMTYILHAGDENIDMYMSFDSTALYNDLVKYMSNSVKDNFNKYLETTEESAEY